MGQTKVAGKPKEGCKSGTEEGQERGNPLRTGHLSSSFRTGGLELNSQVLS